MAKLFISYSSQDRDIALKIADDLAAAGHEVWIDRKGIGGGAKWAAEIVKGIEGCDHFVLLLSPTSLTSDNVRKEIDLAAEEKRPFLPVRLKLIDKIPSDFRYHLAGIQHIDFTGSYEDGFDNLTAALPKLPDKWYTAKIAFQQGIAAFTGKDLIAALEAFNEAIHFQPEFAPAYFMRGNIYVLQDYPKKALEQHDIAIQLDPNFAEAYFNRATVHTLLGNKNQAIEDLEKAKQLGFTGYANPNQFNEHIE